jgi:hypothetical protein
MAKIILQATAIAVVVFILAAASLTLWRSFHPTSPPNEAHGAQNSEAKDNPGKEDKSLLDRMAEDPVAFFTLWLTLFTGILASFTIWMALSTKDLRDFAEEQARDMKETIAAAKDSADAAKKAVELSDRTAERQLRAYVSPNSGILSNFDPNDLTKAFSAVVLFKNSGQTPAYEFTALGAITFGDFPLAKPLTQPEMTTGPTVIGPGADYITNLAIINFTAAHLEAVKTGKFALYVHGIYSYRDAFDKKRGGEFRFYYGGKDGMRPDHLLIFDVQGNNAN